MKERVLKFCDNVETTCMNTNEFIAEYFKYWYGDCTDSTLKQGESIESILRARRKLIEELIIARCKDSKDEEKEYIKEFVK